MSFISYAQNQEDVMLFRALKGVEKGFYIDVGAQEPILDSVTKAFYERGWCGINVEPVEEFHNKLLADRPKDINLNLALASRTGKLVLHEFPHTGLSTTNDEYSLKHHEAGFEGHVKKVPCTTLDALCRKHGVKEVHFLKIDVEGSEADVIKGFSFKTVRPWILVVEATAPLSTRDTSSEWEDLVLRKRYKFVYFDGLNRFYVAREHIKLAKAFSIPPNCFDDYIKHSYWWSQQELDRVLKQFEEATKENSRLKNDLGRADDGNTHLVKALELSNKEKDRLFNTFEESGNEKTRLTEALERSDKEKDRLLKTLEESSNEKTRLMDISSKLSGEISARDSEINLLRGELDAERLEKEKAVQRLNNELEAAKLKINELNHSSHNWRLEADRRSKELEESRAKIDELNHSTHRWWLEADRLSKEMRAFYTSKSWRITWPLRKLMQLFKWLLVLPSRIILWLVRLPKRSARWLLLKAMVYALKRPGLKVRAIAWLHNYPKLEAKLRRLAQRGQVAIQPEKPSIPAQSVAKSNKPEPATNLSNLTPSARRIYGEVKIAMEQRQKENH